MRSPISRHFHAHSLFTRRRWLFACAPLALAAAADAQVQPGNLTLHLQPIASGLTAPLDLVAAPDGSGRKFVVDQAGQIRVIDANNNLLATPFLNLQSQIPTLNPGYDERGVLGLAFHPDFAQNGRFFVRYSAPRTGMQGEPCFGTSRGCHKEVLAEFTVSSDPNVANPTPTVLLQVDKPQFNHNGGAMRFGPDGYLYFGLGDGGGANDGLADNPPSHGPIGNGQNRDTVLGKVLRLDVTTPGQYAIPPTNPFTNGGGRPEIYAYGFRNPYQLSFDSRQGGTNRLYVADVGQDHFEEVDTVQLGGNYGWVTREGFHCFDPFHPTVPPATCSDTGANGEPLLDPITEYPHTEGISVIGGFVYRGSRLPLLTGKYVFGDFSRSFQSPSGRLFYLDPNDPLHIFEFQLDTNMPLGMYVHGFGEDANGEIYLLAQSRLGPSGSTGVVLQLVPEPASLLLLATGALAAVRRRRAARPPA